jgi:hypothetical protein
MPNFLYVYHGGSAPQTPEEGEKVMAAWMAWYGAMGDAVVDGGNPVMQSWTVSLAGIAKDGGANPASGYTIVSADSHEAACEMAKGCPMVADGSGSVEVAEIHVMS